MYTNYFWGILLPQPPPTTTPPPLPISYTNWTGYYICLKLNHEKWRLDLKNFNKDKLLLSLNQGMLIGAFIRVAADNVTLAWGSYFAIKHLHSNDFIIAYTGCQRQTNWAAAPSSQPLPFKSGWQIVSAISSECFYQAGPVASQGPPQWDVYCLKSLYLIISARRYCSAYSA